MDGGGGPGDSFDPCECICSYDGAMRRLISLLRSSQSYCTDNQCLQELPGPQGTDTGPEYFSTALIMMAWFAVAFLLYLLRPQSMRQPPDEKPTNNDSGSGSNPPAPGVF